MDVILLTKVANLGNIGDRVKVKSGYGRNFLLPKGKATLATPDNVKKFEARRAELEKIARDQFQDAESRAAAFKDFKLQITAKAGTEASCSAPSAPPTSPKPARLKVINWRARKCACRPARCAPWAIT